MKICIAPGCWNVTAGTRCAQHEREWQRARNGRRQKLAYNKRTYRAGSLAGALCVCCGSGEDLTRHHVTPLATLRGDRATVAELPDWACGFPVVAMCRRCNSSIADRIMLTRECPMHGGEIAVKPTSG